MHFTTLPDYFSSLYLQNPRP